MDVNNILASLHGLPALVTGLLGAGGLYKLIEKLLDIRDKAAEREADADGERAKADSERIKDLQNQLIPLATEAASAKWLEKENAKLEKQLEAKDALIASKDATIAAKDHQIYQQGIEIRQLQTVSHSWAIYSKYFDNDEGHAFLRRKMDEERARREAERGEDGVY